jgi:hypothetical protein
MKTPGVAELSVAVTPVAGLTPVLSRGMSNVARSPGSTKPFELPPTSVTVAVPRETFAAPDTAPMDAMAASAMTMPTPESRSVPSPSISIAVLVRAVRICACVSDGFADFSRAAMAAACGAAADVPENVMPKPPAPVTDTRSAAVMSGFWRTVPPVDEKLPSVIAEPSALKKSLRGPSEEKVSTAFAALCGAGNGPEGVPPGSAGVAATPKASAEQE